MTAYFNQTPYKVILKTLNGSIITVKKGEMEETIKENPFVKIKYVGIDKSFKKI